MSSPTISAIKNTLETLFNVSVPVSYTDTNIAEFLNEESNFSMKDDKIDFSNVLEAFNKIPSNRQCIHKDTKQKGFKFWDHIFTQVISDIPVIPDYFILIMVSGSIVH